MPLDDGSSRPTRAASKDAAATAETRAPTLTAFRRHRVARTVGTLLLLLAAAILHLAAGTGLADLAFVVALACLVVAGLVLSRAEALGRALTEAWRKRAPAKVRVARSRR